MSRQVVALAGEVAPGACKIVNVRGREIGIFDFVGEFFALANRCPHGQSRRRARQGSYVAETFPVPVEEDYLVVELTAPAPT